MSTMRDIREEAQMIRLVINIFIIIMIAASSNPGQSRGGRDTASKPNSTKAVKPKQPASSKRASKKRQPLPPQLAEVEIHITPLVSSLVIENSNEQFSTQAGTIKLAVSPGEYTLNASSPGHQGRRFSLSLTPGSNSPVNISLVPLAGYLTVTPNISKASIRIIGLRVFNERVDNFELPPGLYRVEVFKDGYKSSAYDVKIEPAKTIYIAANLERLPPVRTGYVMSVAREKARDANREYHILQLYGTSGETNYPSGLIEVTLFSDYRVEPIVKGMLPGLPCRVDFRAVDDIASIYFAERPAQETRWSRLKLHVFPHKNKKESKFIIKWYAIADATESLLVPPSSPSPDPQHRSFVDTENRVNFNYPVNWQELKLGTVYFAPNGSISRTDSRVNVDRGMLVSIVKAGSSNLRQASLNVIQALLRANTFIRQSEEPLSAMLGNREALVTNFSGRSETTNQIEIVTLYTVMLKGDKLLLIAMVRPQSENNIYLGTFGKIIREFQFY